MPYIPKDQIAAAREMDLLTYLRRFEPQELVHVGGNTYATRSHDSLKISNGMWYWWSRGIGGRSALDYLIKVKGLEFRQAVEILAGAPQSSVAEKIAKQKEELNKLDLMKEYIILNLRLSSGVNINKFKKKFDVDVYSLFGSELKELCDLNLLVLKNDDTFVLTKRGTEVANIVWEKFI